MQILVLIPAYNEAARIGPVLEAARRYLPLLVIDDGSSDGTAAVAEAAGVEALRQLPNQGKGAALRAGFRRAIELDYDGVITLDADGQHDPAEIPLFLEAFAQGQIDLIIGRRDFRQIPGIRRLANRLGEKAFSWAVGRPVPDNQSGYRLISRRLMADLLEAEESGFEFELEMIVTCVRRGYGLDSVPIRTIYAGESSHINNADHLANFLRVIARTRRARRQSI